MKKFLPALMALMVPAAMMGAADVPSQSFKGETITSISPNGEWTVGTTDAEFSLVIRNLVTGKKWVYEDYDAESSMGIQYGAALDQSVSNNGVVVGEINDGPAYWVNGEWHALPQNGNTGRAQVGSVAADGSMIIGAIGKDTGSQIDDVQFTSPCIWYRNDDGTYGNPVFLPQPKYDFTNAIPQYFTLISISEDCKTIAAQMTCNYGMPHVPYAYTLGDNGEWQYQALGLDLINPDNLQFPEYVGEFKGPERPNWEDYMTPEEQAEFELAAMGDGTTNRGQIEIWESMDYTPEDIELLLLEFAENYMTGTNKETYTKLVDAYLDAFYEWLDRFREYENVLAQILTYGMDFVFNNMRISPDGKFIYSTGSKLELVRPNNPENPFDEHFAPVCFSADLSGANILSYENRVVLSSVTADYSVLGSEYLAQYDDRRAFIFPQGAEESVDLMEYFKENDNMGAYTWMEEHMLKEVLTSNATGTGTTIKDTYSMGIPVATPDMGLIAFSTSAYYWYPETDYLWEAFLLNPAREKTGVEAIADSADASISVLPGSMIKVAGNVSTLNVFDMDGRNVFSAANPQGVVATGLPAGIYVVRTVAADGKAASHKAVF